MTFPPVTEHVSKHGDHSTFYLACGPTDGPLVVFVHGWPELSISWRHQLPVMGALGFRAVAPDQRGYSPGARPVGVEIYHTDAIVSDVVGLADTLGARRFHLVGHDWG